MSLMLTANKYESPSSNTTSSETPRLKLVIQELERSSLARQLFPENARLAWPAPFVANNRVYLKFPIFFRKEKLDVAGNLLVQIFAPYATISCDWHSRRIVEYCDLRLRSQKQSPKCSVWQAPCLEAIVRHNDNTSALFRIYQEMLDALELGSELPPFVLSEFKSLLKAIIPPLTETSMLSMPNAFLHHSCNVVNSRLYFLVFSL